MPTAAYEVVTTVEQGMAAIDRYPVVVKADGLAAGKGVVIAADEAQARDDARGVPRAAAARDRAGRGGGVPRRRGAVAARDLRRRARDPDGARAGLQAHLRRRRGAEHRRHGLLLARARLRRGARAGAVRAGPPAGRRRAAPPRHAVPRDPLRRPDAHGRRRARAGVQRALRRPRDAGGAAAAALRPARRARARVRAGRARGRRAGVGRARGRDARARERRLPRVAAHRRSDRRARRRAGWDRGHARRHAAPRGRRDRHRRRPRAQRDGARRRRGRRARGCLCCRRRDPLRRTTAAPGHRSAGGCGHDSGEAR